MRVTSRVAARRSSDRHAFAMASHRSPFQSHPRAFLRGSRSPRRPCARPRAASSDESDRVAGSENDVGRLDARDARRDEGRRTRRRGGLQEKPCPPLGRSAETVGVRAIGPIRPITPIRSQPKRPAPTRRSPRSAPANSLHRARNSARRIDIGRNDTSREASVVTRFEMISSLRM